ncbi:uncharacterized protein BO96DRAFT_346314 [Aspergillus niger CBS 101883]|uniref:Uncharacterized protein n=2 Tax=Aspergillus niger TaxID=5061 RepID=A2QTC2_ASPNC|nr:uncharacterized protein BO96DRAFT_346314 [Aspergillus niger CBS 101883]XP_059605828.1 hypothetical protein An09g01570 [Aspergillus niger]PYH52994.1 hypothetical protein BO96DRAFT_346314 [Aspergillus niger CBS 101883]CAK49078.1 hypothetical protein An09g01570 [Aspergillus niger]
MLGVPPDPCASFAGVTIINAGFDRTLYRSWLYCPSLEEIGGSTQIDSITEPLYRVTALAGNRQDGSKDFKVGLLWPIQESVVGQRCPDGIIDAITSDLVVGTFYGRSQSRTHG